MQVSLTGCLKNEIGGTRSNERAEKEFQDVREAARKGGWEEKGERRFQNDLLRNLERLMLLKSYLMSRNSM